MELICGSHGIINDLRPRQRVKSILSAGFDSAVLDASVLTEPKEAEALMRNNFRRQKGKIYLTENPDRLCEELENGVVRFTREEGLATPVALAPYAAPDINLGKDKTSRAKKLNEVYATLAQETVKAAINAGCESVIVHPLFLGIEVKEEWNVNKSFYRSLAKIAEDADSEIQILLINQVKDINGHFVRGICCEPEEACRWVDELNRECGCTQNMEDASGGNEISDDGRGNKERSFMRFGLCFDVGAGTLCGQDLYSAISPLGERLKAVILRDNDGIHDVAMLPYTSCLRGLQTQYLELIRALRKVYFDGCLIMDFADTYGCMPDRLRAGVMSFAHETGEFLRWHMEMEHIVKRHDKRVLFGAGNMCREYLSNYGADYPPLFTCDNNSDRWGEDFYGITIESPEKLKELSPDTAIFICNMYYDEISEQLREMGLPNPIEWFSDEYMPTFHMERLDMAKDPNEKK